MTDTVELKNGTSNKKSDKFKWWMIAAALSAIVVALVWYVSPQERAKRDVKESLKDPASAIFSKLETCWANGSAQYVSGYVNSRNSYGAYSGKTFFVTNFELGLIKTTFNEFDSFWPKTAYYMNQIEIESLKEVSCDKLIDLANDRSEKEMLFLEGS
jgi:hypothetical protein